MGERGLAGGGWAGDADQEDGGACGSMPWGVLWRTMS